MRSKFYIARVYTRARARARAHARAGARACARAHAHAHANTRPRQRFRRRCRLRLTDTFIVLLAQDTTWVVATQQESCDATCATYCGNSNCKCDITALEATAGDKTLTE